eukprot:Skav208429  [mRNA]  locus=scaffold2953:515360:527067:+ [translate_table: standard]
MCTSPSSPSFRSEFRQLRAALLQLREERRDAPGLAGEAGDFRWSTMRFSSAWSTCACCALRPLQRRCIGGRCLGFWGARALQSARYGGQQMMTALKATCRSMAHKLSERAPAIQEALTWLYVCGGSGHQQQVRSSVERFDPNTGHWEALPAMALRRFGSSSAVLDGCLYVCGGSEDQQALNSAERFNPARGLAYAPVPLEHCPRVGSST